MDAITAKFLANAKAYSKQREFESAQQDPKKDPKKAEAIKSALAMNIKKIAAGSGSRERNFPLVESSPSAEEASDQDDEDKDEDQEDDVCIKKDLRRADKDAQERNAVRQRQFRERQEREEYIEMDRVSSSQEIALMPEGEGEHESAPKAEQQRQQLQQQSSASASAQHRRLLRFIPRQSQAHQHRKILKDRLSGVRKPALNRLAKMAGISRVSSDVYPALRAVLEEYVNNVAKTSVSYMDHCKRKTLNLMDVIQGIRSAGFGSLYY
jgi:histone H3/H4